MAVNRQRLEFFKVHVDRVLPTPGVVLKDPLLNLFLLIAKRMSFGILTIADQLCR